MWKKYKNEIYVGIFVLVAFILLAYMSITIGKIRLDKGINVKVVFDNASGIVKDSSVMVAGIEVGHVSSLSIDHNKAIFNIYIKKDAQIRKDVKATIRAKSLLGEKFVELIPQSKTAPLLEEGDIITDTTTPLEIDQLVTSLSPIIKNIDSNKLSQLVNNLLVILDDNDQNISNIIKNLSRITNDIEPKDLQSLIVSLNRLTKNSESFLMDSKKPLENILNKLDRVTTLLEKSSPKILKNTEIITDNISKTSTNALNISKDGEKIAKNILNLTNNLNEKTPEMINKIDNSLQKLPTLIENTDKTVQKGYSVLSKGENILENNDFSTLAQKVNKILSKLENINEDDLKKLIEGGKLKINLF